MTLSSIFVSLYPKWVIASTKWIFSFDIEESCTLFPMFPIRCSLNFSWGFMGWFLSFLGKSKVWCCLFLSCKMNSGKSMPPVDNERKWTSNVPHFWAVLSPIKTSYVNNNANMVIVFNIIGCVSPSSSLEIQFGTFFWMWGSYLHKLGLSMMSS